MLPSIYNFKPAFQRLLQPLVSRLARAGITANQLTLAGLAVSFAGGMAVALAPTASAPLLALPLVLVLRMALNALDGMLARQAGQESRLGAVLNEICDLLGDIVLYLPLALVPGLDASLIVLIVALALTVEATGILARALGGDRAYHGPMGKSDRALAFALLALILGLGLPAGAWSAVYLAVMIALLLVTLWRRAQAAVSPQ